MKVIGLDVGEKRIGVAKADSDTRIAVPVGFLLADGSEWQEIAHIANLNSTNWIVLGLPRSNDGNETAQSRYVRDFARKLVQHVPGLKIRFQDESLTSVEAENRLKARKKKYQRGDIDAEAAAIILQDFMENVATSNPSLGGAAEPMSGKASKPKDKEEDGHKDERYGKLSGKAKITIVASLTVLALVLLGATVALKIRDHIRAEREAEYARQEAEMKAEVFNFMIRPGETIFDVRRNLINAGYLADEVDDALNAEYDFEFLKERPAGASLEGYLYPETHEFYRSDSAKTVIERFLTGMGEIISKNELEAKYAAHGLTLYQGITLASVVQKESGVPSDQATVAQVFYSRLAYGWRMGSDVTVSYALDVLDPERTVYRDSAAALTVNSCYNTRLYAGLPCGPISNPGLSALLAVAEPSDTAYLYFLTGDDGLMYYSYTEAEHNTNILLHCQELCNVAL